jgi:predicted PhzF superfamily epimerase YddE/YHI9
MSDTKAHFLCVFTNQSGKYGDLASVVIDEDRHIPDSKRQTITRKLHTGETTFINDVSNANISIMHYQGEVSFAGTVALATAWLLAKLRREPIEIMHGRDGDIITWQEGGLIWVRTDLSTMPPWHHKQLESSEAIEQITVEEAKAMEHTMVWAWIDQAEGLIRARTFASDWDIPEAQGNGSGSMMLAARLQRAIEIKHGKGSVIFAKPVENNQAAIGGRVVEDQEPRLTQGT